MKRFLVLIALFTLFGASTSRAQIADPIGSSPAATDGQPLIKAYAAANLVYFDAKQGTLPSDFEVGGSGRISLSPHISGVGSVVYGVNHTYIAGAAGGRITATDANNPDFSIGLGLQYHSSSKLALRPQEWAPDVTLGIRPWPEKMPRLVVGVQGGYGLKSQQASVLLAARYNVGSIGGGY